MTSAKIISYTGARHEVTGMLSRRPRRSLDIGCSNGALSRVLVDDGVEAWGIEIDPVFAAQAAGTLAVVLVGDAKEQTATLVERGEQFDAVIAADSLEHMVDPWSVMANARQLIEPDGEMIVSLPNVRFYTTLVWLLGKGRWRYLDRGVHDRTHLRWFTDGNARDMFEAAGFRVDAVSPIYRLFDAPDHPRNPHAPRVARLLPPLRSFLAYQYLYRLKPA